MSMMTDRVQPPAPIAEDLQSNWLLDDAITFLNHGSFGACPREVLAAQDAWRAKMEARPIEFLDRTLEDAFQTAREKIAPFLGLPRDDFAFVTNATSGVNAVLRSLQFEPGDELLTTSHVYPAVRQTMKYLAARAGATLREVTIDLPLSKPDDVLTALRAARTDRTRLVLVDHITSPTALRFPVEAIVKWCRDENLVVFVDGAHAPGMLELDVASIGADWYTGNFHKWCCAPKGAAFLYAAPERQRNLHPPTLSHFVGDGFLDEFNWQGTRDVTPWLTVPAAIEWMAQFDWKKIRAHNSQLARWAHAMLCDAWQVEPISPINGAMLGSMAAVRLPASITERWSEPIAFKKVLYDEHRIEVPINEFAGGWLLRVSCQIYNRPEQYERLAEVVRALAR